MAGKVIAALDALINFLEDHQDRKWLPLLIQVRLRALAVPEGDAMQWRSLMTDISSLYGGMGSLNDLCVCPENGHRVANVRKANKQFTTLIQTLYAACEKGLKSFP